VEFPTREELERAVNAIKNNRAPGIDGIWKGGGEDLFEALYGLITKVWNRYEGYPENNFRFIITKTPLQLQKFYYYSLKLHPLTIFLHSFHPHW
jgi:hypothetical protein